MPIFAYEILMPKNVETNITVLTSATSTSKSLRATVPAFITSQFHLKKGDALRWLIGEKIIVEVVRHDKLDKLKKER